MLTALKGSSKYFLPAPKIIQMACGVQKISEWFVSFPNISQVLSICQDGRKGDFFFLSLTVLSKLQTRWRHPGTYALPKTMRCPLPSGQVSLVEVMPSSRTNNGNASGVLSCRQKAHHRAGASWDESWFQWTLCFKACFLWLHKSCRRNIPLESADTKECCGWKILSSLPVPQ